MLYQTFFSISYQRRFPETRLLEAMTRCFKNGKQELIFKNTKFKNTKFFS